MKEEQKEKIETLVKKLKNLDSIGLSIIEASTTVLESYQRSEKKAKDEETNRVPA